MRSMSFTDKSSASPGQAASKVKGLVLPQPTESLVDVKVIQDRTQRIIVEAKEEDVIEYGDEDEDGEWTPHPDPPKKYIKNIRMQTRS